MCIKRVGIMLCAILTMLLAGCVREADTRKIVHDGAIVNARILSVDAERNEAVVRDSDAAGIFGDGCTLDCMGASTIYCDYGTGEVWGISLADLSEGDEVIIQIGASEIQNAKMGRAKITQIQLSTQRLEK